MKLNALRDFLAVAETGGLRAAARQLGAAQPAITRSIQELEKELGVALFERSAKGVRLTPMGTAFMRRASAVRNELHKAKDEMAQLRGETHGRVSVCLSSASHMAPAAAGAAALPGALSECLDGNHRCSVPGC